MPKSDDGSTALLWAAHWNDLDTADLLLRAGADANAANDFRMTPLSAGLHERKRRVRAVAPEVGRESKHARSPPAKLR